jgi:hypothetical protein
MTSKSDDTKTEITYQYDSALKTPKQDGQTRQSHKLSTYSEIAFTSPVTHQANPSSMTL